MTMLRRAQTALLLIPLLLLSACVKAPGIQDGYVDYDKVSCGDLQSHENDYIAVDASLKDPVVMYTDSGADKWDSQTKFIASECDNASRSVTEILNLLHEPTCTAFVGETNDVQAAWLEAEIGTIEPLTMEEAIPLVVTRCKNLGDDDDTLGNGVLAVGDEIAKRARAAEIAATLPRQMAWTTTSKLGYVVNVLVQVGPQLAPEVTTHPLNDEAVLGSGCGFDPTTDIAFPARMLDTNAADKATAVQSAVHLAGGGSADITSGYIDSGNFCSSTGRTSASLNIHHDPVEAGDNWGIVFFIIIKDYYSPRYPDGAKSELLDYGLYSAPYRADELSDPIVQESSASMSVVG